MDESSRRFCFFSFALAFELSRHCLITDGVSELFPAEINSSTRYCAVLGHPIKHSASPAMHNAAMAALGLNWRYLAFEVLPEKLGTAIEGAKNMGFAGLNLTVPHKLLALGLVDVVEEDAAAWGAVNTIAFEGRDPAGNWKPLGVLTDEPREIRSRGYNTDAEAITRSLKEDLGLDCNGASVLLLGAGGAGRTAALKLASEGVGNLCLINRTRSKAEQIGAEINKKYPATKVSYSYPSGSVDLLLNATSLGLAAVDEMPFSLSDFKLSNARCVYDMIYRPAETPLLAAAKKAGCRTANGLGMLLYQGAKALELWTGKTAPIEIMRQALKKNVYGE